MTEFLRTLLFGIRKVELCIPTLHSHTKPRNEELRDRYDARIGAHIKAAEKPRAELEDFIKRRETGLGYRRQLARRWAAKPWAWLEAQNVVHIRGRRVA